jgi:hypothetical protein
MGKIFIGTSNVNRSLGQLKVGNNQVNKVYIGSTLIWPTEFTWVLSLYLRPGSGTVAFYIRNASGSNIYTLSANQGQTVNGSIPAETLNTVAQGGCSAVYKKVGTSDQLDILINGSYFATFAGGQTTHEIVVPITTYQSRNETIVVQTPIPS